MPDELAVIQRAYDLTAWAVPAIAKFPRSHRFVPLDGRPYPVILRLWRTGRRRSR